MATVRCEEIANEKFACFSTDEVIFVWCPICLFLLETFVSTNLFMISGF